MPRPANITPTPFRSSNLSIPPSPFSPRSPLLLPPLHRPSHSPDPPRLHPNASSPPRTPLHWLWQCHICNRTYRIGVTRRCLDDGHAFCSGTSVVRQRAGSNVPRKTKRHRACASEFDYQGWKNWGVWRRGVLDSPSTSQLAEEAGESFVQSAVSPLFGKDAEEKIYSVSPSRFRDLTTTRPSPLNMTVATRPERPQAKNCWNRCDYPSACRWGKQFGVQSPAAAAGPLTPTSPPSSSLSSSSSLSFFEPDEDLDMPVLERMGSSSSASSSSMMDFGDFLAREQMNGTEDDGAKKRNMDVDIGVEGLGILVMEAKERVRGRGEGMAHSPLSGNPVQGLVAGMEELKIEGHEGKGKRGSVASSAILVFNEIVSSVVGVVGGVVGAAAPLEEDDARAEGFGRASLMRGKKRKECAVRGR